MNQKLLYLSFLFLILQARAAGQTQFWSDNFEDTGAPSSGTRTPETDGGSNTSYFKRTDGTGLDLQPTSGLYTGFQGSKFWAGEDFDGFGMNQELQIEWTNINIAGKSGLSFSGLFAAHNGSNAWENLAYASSHSDYITVEYAINGGVYQNLVQFMGNNSVDKRLARDADFDGLGEGALLSKTFQEFSQAIPGTGNTLSIRIRCFSNDPAEEFAWDNFRLFEVPSCTAPSFTGQPANRNICNNTGTTFSVAATGATGYQWQVDTGGGFTDLTNTAPYSNVTTSTLTITGATAAMSGYQYRCRAINGSATCFTNSNAATLGISLISTSTGSSTNLTCSNICTGTASVTPSGGIGSYSYSWSPSGGTASTATSLCAGTYTVTVTDGIGCQATRSYTITAPPALTTTGSQTNLLCNGVPNGTATVTASGGTPPYSYSWSPSGGTASTASGLAAATYTVTVTDNNSCQTTRSFTLTQPGAFSVTPASANLLCNGASTGSASVTVSGATPPYTYTWSPSGGTAAAASNLAAGNYTVTIKDANLCQTTQSFSLTEPPAIVLLGVGDASICAGQSAALNAAVAGGTPPFTYQWMPGPLNGAAQNVTPDTSTYYVVKATDNNNCFKTDTVVVTVNANIAQAIAGSGMPVAGTASSSSSGQTAAGLQSFYAGGNCAIIASVQDNAGLGAVTASVTANTAVPVIMGRPYVPRWYQITPQNNVTAQVVLYFTQADFDLYNTYAQGAGLPGLPQNPADQAGIDSLVITRTSGGPAGTGANSLIHPSSVVWDATMKYWKVTFTAPSFSYFYVHANNASNTPLPVILGTFTATRVQQQAVLAWTTMQEQHNKGFVIERSADGKQFLAIGAHESLAPGGSSKEQLQYRFADVSPLQGMNYYRLVQEDRDGGRRYSDIRYLDFTATPLPFRIYPNPAEDMLKIAYTAKESSGIAVCLADMTGRVALVKEWAAVRGENLYRLPLNGLPQGVYYLSISDAAGTVHRVKVVKK